jgi:DNA-directed RNA polymerase specialized sigma24 family protein
MGLDRHRVTARAAASDGAVGEGRGGEAEEIAQHEHGALDVLPTIDTRLVQVVECRFFGGLSVEETAEVMATSTRTVKRDWRRARAWLYDRLGGTAGTGPV